MLQIPQANLGTLQILQNRNRFANTIASLTNPFDLSIGILVFGMTGNSNGSRLPRLRPFFRSFHSCHSGGPTEAKIFVRLKILLIIRIIAR